MNRYFSPLFTAAVHGEAMMILLTSHLNQLLPCSYRFINTEKDSIFSAVFSFEKYWVSDLSLWKKTLVRLLDLGFGLSVFVIIFAVIIDQRKRFASISQH